MRRLFTLEKQLQELTGQTYKVYAVERIADGYGALTSNEQHVIKIREDQLKFEPLFWHEMGHVVKDKDGQSLWRAEYAAQKWALKTLLSLKKRQLYRRSIAWIKEWLETDDETITPADIAYAQAGVKLLKEFK